MNTTQRLARFETAQELLSMLAAHKSTLIHQETKRLAPDQGALDQLRREKQNLCDQEEALSLNDIESIEHVISTYAPQVRKLYQ